MAFPGVPHFTPGDRLQNGDILNNFVFCTLSVDNNARAHAGGGQQFASLIDAAVNIVTRVTTAGDSFQLPPTNGRYGFGPSLAGLVITIINTQANTCQLFGNWMENAHIGGVAGSTGIAISGGAVQVLVCSAIGQWTLIPASLAGGTLTGFLEFTSATDVASLGTNQATAKLISTQILVATSCPAGTGFRLPALADLTSVNLGPISFKNKDPVNNVLLYPPVGGSIDGNAINAAVIVFSLDELNLVPDVTTPLKWWS